MINLSQNTANNVFMNLTSNSNSVIFSATTPYFLFEFTSEATNQVIYFVTDNIAPISARSRYDEFVITESGSTFINLTGGTVYLTPGYVWTYKVYEQSTRNNLNPALALDVVSVGRVFYTPKSSNGFIAFTGATSNNIFFTKY